MIIVHNLLREVEKIISGEVHAHKTPLVESMHSEWIAFSPSPIHSFLLILILIVGRFLQTERAREGGQTEFVPIGRPLSRSPQRQVSLHF